MKNIDKVEKILIEEGINVISRIEKEGVSYIGFDLNGNLFTVELYEQNINIVDHQKKCSITLFDVDYFKEKIEKLKSGMHLYDTLL